MRTKIVYPLIIVFFVHMLNGCTNKEAVKTEEPIVPAIVAAPEAPPPSAPEQTPQPLPVPPPKPPPPTPVLVKADVQEEQKVMPASQQKTVSA